MERNVFLAITQKAIVGVLSVLMALACGDDDDDSASSGKGGAFVGKGGSGGLGGAAAAEEDAGASTSEPLEVATDKGRVRGDVSSEGVRAFKGMPFAAPPIGANRWKAPQPVEPWTETRDATAFSHICPQMNVLTKKYDADSDEDCLYLNVWTPDPPPSKPLPVMVWLHPGAYFFGSGVGDTKQYVGDNLVKKGVIIVTLNYRLSALGFLAHKELTAENPSHFSSNYGLLDQIEALKWVQHNIAAFGGDRDNVTIFGESAGGRSIALFLTSPSAKGLFHKAIAQSGLVMMTTAQLTEAEQQGDRFAKAKGCTDSAAVLTCLRGLPADQLAGVPADLIAGTETPKGGIMYVDKGKQFFFEAISDGVVIPDTPEKLYRDKKLASDVPVINGATTSEGTLFHGGVFGEPPVADQTEYETVLAKRFDRVAEISSHYSVAGYPSANDALTAVTGDAFFVCPARRMARYLAAAGIKNYLYSFNLTLDEVPLSVLKDRAFHSVDLAYVFGNRSILGRVSETNQPVSEAVMNYWTRFVATGDPNGSDTPNWPAFDDTSPYLNFNNPIEAKTDLKKDKCDFWDTVHMSR